jgi:hypothetical protein
MSFSSGAQEVGNTTNLFYRWRNENMQHLLAKPRHLSVRAMSESHQPYLIIAFVTITRVFQIANHTLSRSTNITLGQHYLSEKKKKRKEMLIMTSIS